MTKEQEALRLALHELEGIPFYRKYGVRISNAITAINEALAQPDHIVDANKMAQPAQEPDWKDQYEKQKRRAEMWIAKYEKDIGPLEKAVPVAQEPRNFCPRCGKRRGGDVNYIHTCTPPRGLEMT